MQEKSSLRKSLQDSSLTQTFGQVEHRRQDGKCNIEMQHSAIKM